MTDSQGDKIPVTVFTGYLGSGKTTVIMNLVKQLDPAYKIVWLKNEYGNLDIDGELAKEENIAVKEMLNGCLCCVLVGRLRNAVEEILEKYSPERIIIESSGTAYPLPIVLELSRVEGVYLDGVITVVDVLNFSGYADKGEVARMQAEATDLSLLNKVEQASEEQTEQVLDMVLELNPNTPTLRTRNGYVSKDLLLGLDSKLLEMAQRDEDAHDHDQEEHHHPDEVDTFEYYNSDAIFQPAAIAALLLPLKDRDFIRIKGVIKTPAGYQMLNWVFGRLTWHPLHKYTGQTKIVFMGRGISSQESIVKSRLSELAS